MRLISVSFVLSMVDQLTWVLRATIHNSSRPFFLEPSLWAKPLEMFLTCSTRSLSPTSSWTWSASTISHYSTTSCTWRLCRASCAPFFSLWHTSSSNAGPSSTKSKDLGGFLPISSLISRLWTSFRKWTSTKTDRTCGSPTMVFIPILLRRTFNHSFCCHFCCSSFVSWS